MSVMSASKMVTMYGCEDSCAIRLASDSNRRRAPSVFRSESSTLTATLRRGLSCS